jgi:hypothetical protein
VAVQPQKDVLRHLFGRRAIPEEVERDAEHHSLMLPDKILEPEHVAVGGPGRVPGPVDRLHHHRLSHIHILETNTRERGREDAKDCGERIL